MSARCEVSEDIFCACGLCDNIDLIFYANKFLCHRRHFEIVNKAKTYVGSTYVYFATYAVVALMYLVIISILMIVSNYVEKKLKYEARKGKRHRDEH